MDATFTLKEIWPILVAIVGIVGGFYKIRDEVLKHVAEKFNSTEARITRYDERCRSAEKEAIERHHKLEMDIVSERKLKDALSENNELMMGNVKAAIHENNKELISLMKEIIEEKLTGSTKTKSGG